jgi:hypothetical protein
MYLCLELVNYMFCTHASYLHFLYIKKKEPAGMEDIYKFLLPGTIFHKLWYSPSDDVSESLSEHR